MANIVEFLLARIAEDEAETWTLEPYECPPGCCAPAGWVGRQCRYCHEVPVYGGTRKSMEAIARDHAEQVHQRSRVLAECAAKRAIVKRNAELARIEVRRQTRTLAGDTLAHLAAVYADHPDYDPAWAV